jgi:hypothetical protein
MTRQRDVATRRHARACRLLAFAFQIAFFDY